MNLGKLNKAKYSILKILSPLPFIGLALSSLLDPFVNSVSRFPPSSLMSKIIGLIYEMGAVFIFSYPLAIISTVILFILLLRKSRKNIVLSISDKAYLIICPLLFIGFIGEFIYILHVEHQFQLQKDIF